MKITRQPNLGFAVSRGALVALASDLALFAEENAAAPEDATVKAAELAKKLSNPVASLISVPTQANFDNGLGPNGAGTKFTLHIQPVIPISISEDWHVISRTILPVIYQSDVTPNRSQGGLGYWAESPRNGPEGLHFRSAATLLFPQG